jgi:FKBP-type peptidyl-prolyl cis-trans isomerase
MAMKNPVSLSLLLLLGMMLVSCREQPAPKVQTETPQLKESLEKANRYLVAEEEEDIQNYIARHKLAPIATGTGLRYQVTQSATGDSIRPGQRVSIDYVLYNIMGDVLYSSEKDGVKTFEAGCGDVEAGLDEAILHLRKGEVATVIIPSHLAHGLQGDHDRIPPRATLIYIVKIIDVKE